ncbi:metal-sensitive transcriptional regulator [Desulfitobacterium sp.]|uniref:metal-sensitive transcriptional regulator n=1 Tax=Desulfitobacterium sp. TaxID=49981 RepID=UPI002B1F899A|nr:metal-sensitive transcriptional regulator [Desulfitobacterium sp.]MEA4901337.1 metal-sensitive transcriptional regulator [Desulfitobacterium sp.]
MNEEMLSTIDPEDRKKIITRLKTVKGHVAAVERMVEEGKGCEEVLLQLVAIKSAVQKVSVVVAQHYTNICLVEALEKGDDKREVLNKAVETLMKLND